MNRSYAWRGWFTCCLLVFAASCFCSRVSAAGLPSKLGDFDGDGIPTIFDLQRLVNHVNRTQPLTSDLLLLADVNQDGFVNDADVELFGNAILDLTSLPDLPLTTIRETSPSSGESGVTVTRETVFRFNYPLGSNTFLGSTQLYAEFGGRRLLSRVELSSDRKTVTLFYLENLPGGARIRVTFDPVAIQDVLGRLVDLDGDGQPGGIKVVDFDTLGTTPIAGTAIIGNVFASDPIAGTNSTNFINRPLGGVTITVDGMEETLRAVTDSNGFFRLSPCPAGDFFVHIDGRTLTNVAAGIRYPDLSYYPFVGKMWTAAPGRTNNLAGGTGLIYLPLITQGTLRAVSMTNDTMVTFPTSVLSNNPALSGVTLTVPSNSLFSANGARGGSVGIAPVSPDRLPGPLPPGLNFPLVITVQTSGPENFDRPVPVRFPNLPDPVTGLKLLPGAKTALWSFDHDKGDWEVVGSMTVSADGLYIESDPGVGILQPGWHGSFPGVRGGGGKIRPPPPPKPCMGNGPCDDGDPCTTNDRCQNGICKGDSPMPECGPNMATAIDYSMWTETMVAAGGNVTAPNGFTVSGDSCYDPGSGAWKFNITSIKSLGNVNLTLSDSMEPNPIVGGNVTASNYCTIIKELEGYLGRGRGDWHTLAASRAHEHTHRDFELQKIVNPLWAMAEAAMESECVACSKSSAEANRILQKTKDDILQRLRMQFTKDWNAYHPDHDTARNDEPYQEGQKELNKMIEMIRAFATSQGFPPCPAPAPFLVRAKASLSETARLVRLDAFVPTNLIDVGTTAQIAVIGQFSDGSISNLTSVASGTKYSGDDPEVLAVADDGLVSARRPGATTVLISHSPDVDSRPLLAAVNITVRSADDFDNDDMPDNWERANGLNPNDPSDADKDADGDGVTNLQEYRIGSNPRLRDSDNDGVSDGQELIEGSNPMGSGVPDLTPQTGLHYFMLMNLDTGDVIQRGIAGDNGVAFKNLILAPNTHYRQFILQAATLYLGSSDFTTPDSGASITLPAVPLHSSRSVDSDGDGLPDDAEVIMGTDTQKADSDGDGIRDGAEVQQGTDPLSNVPVRTGVLASADTPGSAVDVCAVNDIAIVADSTAGITVFNVANALNPTRIAQVDTPGSAVAVACSGNLVAVGDDSAGLAIIDVTDPPAARILYQINLGSAVRAVTASGGIAYAGLMSGHVVSVDMASGTVLERVSLGAAAAVQDLAVGGDTLYALRVGTLHALPLNADALRVSATVSSPGSLGAAGRRLRLFVGSDLAYATHTAGYNTFSLVDPSRPVLIQQRSTTQFGWKQIVANGSGLGVAAVDQNSTDDGAHDISLYNLGASGTNGQFVTTFATPGLAAALSIYNGLAYVADSLSGLQVVNYIAYDALGMPPAVSLAASFPLIPAQAEEGKTVRITANVTDDVQVRNVEFYVDGVKVATDGSFPFEQRFATPLLTTTKTNFTIRAKARDTGGNSTWSAEIVVALVPDATPPTVTRVHPASGAIVGQSEVVIVYFNEPIDPATLNGATFQLRSAGADGVLDNNDDVSVTNGTISYRDDLNAAFLNFPTNLPAALYRAQLGPPVADLAGNRLARAFIWQFWITGGRDSDQDGIPDEVEVALGLDRFNPDTDGDGIVDGDEDFDGDGLATKWELLFGYDPRVGDTDGNGVTDRLEDPDGDALTNLQEQTRRTHPRNADSDGDGWSDEAEVTSGSDPLNPNVRPKLFFIARPSAALVLPGIGTTGGLAANVTVARPPVSLTLPGVGGTAGLSLNVTIARPAAVVTLPGISNSNAVQSVTVARPSATVILPAANGAGGVPSSTTIAQPPVKVRINP